MLIQYELSLKPASRGCHLITSDVVAAIPELREIEVGLLHAFIQHTSASLTLNENADPDVRFDMETALNTLVPENQSFTHACEGPDDMPAHVKASLFGPGVLIPVRGGKLALGTWQGIYLCEHRDHGGPRHLVLTLLS